MRKLKIGSKVKLIDKDPRTKKITANKIYTISKIGGYYFKILDDNRNPYKVKFTVYDKRWELIEEFKHLQDEINKGDVYLVDGIKHTVESIRITNVYSSTDFIVSINFVDENGIGFQEKPSNLINNSAFKRI